MGGETERSPLFFVDGAQRPVTREARDRWAYVFFYVGGAGSSTYIQERRVRQELAVIGAVKVFGESGAARFSFFFFK